MKNDNKELPEGIRYIRKGEENFPEKLLELQDCPDGIYVKGSLPDPEKKTVAIVGARMCTAYGRATASHFARELAAHDVQIISGLALGIDGAAHQGALIAGGATFGVLAGGVDICYPRGNIELYTKMNGRSGILSEESCGCPPLARLFPKRNRIISALSDLVLVVEARQRSGSLITARQALEQGRDVFCVPGNVDMPTFTGSNALMRDGAIPVRDGWDVVSEYKSMYPDAVHPMEVSIEIRDASVDEKVVPKVAEKPRYPEKKRLIDKKKEKKPIDNGSKQPYSDVKDKLSKLPDTERQIAELLTSERLVDDLIAETSLPAAKVGAALTMLEIKGIIKRLPGKRISLK